MSYKFLFQNKIQLIIFVNLFLTISNINFIYPNSVTLNNKNIFVIHRYGVSICNSFCSRIIKEVLTFSISEEISTEDKLSKVTISQFDDGSIICIIIDKIYFFDANGEFEFKSSQSLTTYTNIYYTISPHKIENNYYYYLVGYAYNQALYLYYYQYCPNSNGQVCIEKNTLVASNEELKPRNGVITNNGLSFQFNSEDDLILCMYYLVLGRNKYLTVEFLFINDNSINFQSDNINFEFDDGYSDIACLKSAIYTDGLKAIFCMYNTIGFTKCLIYDMNDKYQYWNYVYDKNCLTKYYGMNIKYFPEKEQFVFSCLMEEGGVHFEIMDKSFNYPYPYGYPIYKFTEYPGDIYGHSILYYISKDCYYILFDLKYNETEYTFKPLKDNIIEYVEESDESYNTEENRDTDNEKNKENENGNDNSDENNENNKENEKGCGTSDENKGNNNENGNDNSDTNKENNKEKENGNDNSDENKENNNENEKGYEISDGNKENNKENEKGYETSDENKGNIKENENMKENSNTIIENEKGKDIIQKEDIKENEVKMNECKELEKCGLCNEESIANNLCLSCNSQKGFFPLNAFLPIKLNNNYVECINADTKPSNFYFDKQKEEFSPCYETCATCDYGGDSNENNCTSCEINYIFKPDITGTTNCVASCLFSYYYSNFGQYRCTSSPQCPDGYNFFIQEKGKCIDNCENDNLYKFQFNGACLNKCPMDTESKIGEYLCKDINSFNCFLSDLNYIKLNDNITDSEIELMAKNYALEFKYTDNHVSMFKNDIYTLCFYKNGGCVSQLISSIPEVDFGECIEKVKNNYQIEDELVIVIATKTINGKSYEILNSFSMFDPNSGQKLSYDNICQDDVLNVTEYLFDKLNISIEDLEPIVSLFNQDIDIFNLSSAFYTDICYDFVSPIKGKDIPLKDRISLFYPNITLCENGCDCIGVNITSFKSICECKYKNFIDNNFILSNPIYQSQLNKINKIFEQTNIEVMKCYKYFLAYKSYISSIGFFIIFGLFIIQIIITIIFHIKNIYIIRKYIFCVTNKYISYLLIQNNNNILNGAIFKMNNNSNNKESPEKKEKERRIPKRKSTKSKITPLIITQKANPSKNNKLNRNSVNDVKNNSTKDIFSSKNTILYNKIKNGISYKLKKHSRKTLSKINLEDFLASSNDNINMIKKKSFSSFQLNINSDLKFNEKDIFNINVEEYLSTEIDNLDYYDTIRKDHRKFCEYLLYKLKNNQMILSIFFNKDPLNPRKIKISLLILDIDLYLFVNGLFFTENYISELLHISNEENILDYIDRFIDRFVFISIVGVIINYMVDFFFIDERVIKGIFKREKDNLVVLKYEISKIINKYLNRYRQFIVAIFIIIFFTFFYIICFNNVYPSVMGEWIITTVILIVIMQLISVLQYLLESCIRFISFKCKSEKLYKLSLLFS